MQPGVTPVSRQLNSNNHPFSYTNIPFASPHQRNFSTITGTNTANNGSIGAIAPNSCLSPTKTNYFNASINFTTGSKAMHMYSTAPLYKLPYTSAFPIHQPVAEFQNSSSGIPPAQRGPTVYLGHLTQNTDDMVIRQLLQECGRVIRWSRTTDPSTKKLSSFGFCEFDSPLGVMRAVRCLNGLVLDGQQLVANCEDKLKGGLEQWRRDRKNKLLEENPSKSIQEIEADIEKEEISIEETIKKMATDWNSRASVLNEESVTSNSDIQTSSKSVYSEKLEPNNPTFQNKTREERLELMPNYIILPLSISLSSRPAGRIRLWNTRLREGRIEARKRLQVLERNEAHLLRMIKIRREESHRQTFEPCLVSKNQKKRLVDLDKKDLVYIINNDGVVWEGESSLRRVEDRQIKIKRERASDREYFSSTSEKNSVIDKKLSEDKYTIKEFIESKLVGTAVKPILHETSDDTVSKIVCEISKNTNQDISKPIKISLTKLKQKIPSSVQSTQDSKVNNQLFLNFEQEDESNIGSTNELLIQHKHSKDTSDISIMSPDEFVLGIVSQVPKNKNDLFSFQLDWNLLEKHQIFDVKVIPWIRKKLLHYLGEDELELAEFLTDMIKNKHSPFKLIEEFKEFLDEQAEIFIIKLWKLLIFEELWLKQNDHS